MKAKKAARNEDNAKEPVLYMAAELGAQKWNLAFCGPRGSRQVTLDAWDCEGVNRELAKAKTKVGLPAAAPVLAVQEAGRDGFSVHRFFETLSIQSLVVDPASIEVPRRQRRAKTDRLDADRLVALLRRWHGGERTALRVVRVPTVAQEDARQLPRERERLVEQRTRLTNRLRALLATQGLRLTHVDARLAESLDRLRGRGNLPLPGQLRWVLRSECALLAAVEGQLAALEQELAAQLAAPHPTPQLQAAQRVQTLKGIGGQTAVLLGTEFFWRDFHNRKEVGSAAGLTGTPFLSGSIDHEQGISKAGNWRVRRAAVQAAWRWVKWQPESTLTRWFNERFAAAGARQRRVGIVGVARKLLIALWRLARTGQWPEGAVAATERSRRAPRTRDGACPAATGGADPAAALAGEI
jgi:transposase